MARVVVDVMLKPEILDPQGQAVANALPRLGVGDVAAVRIGRRIEIDFTGEPDLAKAREIADKLLANPVIEDFTVRIEPPAPASTIGAESGPEAPAADDLPDALPADEPVPGGTAEVSAEEPAPAAVDEPVTVAGPAADEPVADELVTDEPAADEPVADEQPTAEPEPAQPDATEPDPTEPAPVAAGGDEGRAGT